MKKIDIIFREETPNDYPKIYDLNLAAFERDDEAKLVDRLRSSNAFIKDLSLIAEVDGIIVGHILFTKISIRDDKHCSESLALAPMAIQPDYQKKGVGTSLVKRGLNKAGQMGYKSVIVLGHEDFYPRFNFQPANKWYIKAPFNVPEKSFMGVELCEGAFEKIQGTVEYAPEFDML